MATNEEVRYKAEQKRQHIIIIAAVLLLIGLILIAIGTFAYYRSTVTGTITGTIATWSFEANDATETFTTIVLAPTQTTKTLNATMAPGTSGSFDIVLDTNGSTIPVEYVITFSNFTNVPANLQFYSDENFTTVTDIRTTGYKIEGELASNSTYTKTIYWKWAYGAASSVTADNSSASKNVSFGVSIIGKQKDQ